MKRYTFTTLTMLTPQRLYRAVTDISRWPDWDSELEATSHDGRLEAGAPFMLKPKGGPKVSMTIEKAEEPCCFVDIAHLPLAEDAHVAPVYGGTAGHPHRHHDRNPGAARLPVGQDRGAQAGCRNRRADASLPRPCGDHAVSGRAATCWLAVACAEHVQAGKTAGIMQVCHGKAGPLRRIRAGDEVVYYSPSGTFRGTDRLQAFTAIGRVISAAPYPFDMGGGFVPFRHDVTWRNASDASIRPLLEALSFTSGRANWGYAFRFGLLEITRSDGEVIAAAMMADGSQAATRLRPACLAS
jgi:hypothetical protein